MAELLDGPPPTGLHHHGKNEALKEWHGGLRQALESLGSDGGEVFSRRQVHFNFIKDLKGRILVEGDVLSRVALDVEFAKFIQELF